MRQEEEAKRRGDGEGQRGAENVERRREGEGDRGTGGGEITWWKKPGKRGTEEEKTQMKKRSEGREREAESGDKNISHNVHKLQCTKHKVPLCGGYLLASINIIFFYPSFNSLAPSLQHQEIPKRCNNRPSIQLPLPVLDPSCQWGLECFECDGVCAGHFLNPLDALKSIQPMHDFPSVVIGKAFKDMKGTTPFLLR